MLSAFYKIKDHRAGSRCVLLRSVSQSHAYVLSDTETMEHHISAALPRASHIPVESYGRSGSSTLPKRSTGIAKFAIFLQCHHTQNSGHKHGRGWKGQSSKQPLPSGPRSNLQYDGSINDSMFGALNGVHVAVCGGSSCMSTPARIPLGCMLLDQPSCDTPVQFKRHATIAQPTCGRAASARQACCVGCARN